MWTRYSLIISLPTVILTVTGIALCWYLNALFIATPVPVTKVTNQANPGTTGNANSIAGTGKRCKCTSQSCCNRREGYTAVQ